MNKNSIYIGISVLIGLLLGYFIFGSSSEETLIKEHGHTTEASVQMWTCAMHPDIMQTESGDCPICGMDLIPAEISADGLAADQFRMTENAMALANIQTSVIGGTDAVSEGLKLSGKITENEEANAVQVAYVAGRIEKLFINATGENVHKGQLLATVYSPELVAAQQELLTAVTLKKSQPELYNAVRNKLKLWKLSENQINQIETSGKVKEILSVYARVSGTISMKMVEAGEYVKQGQPLYKIANLTTVWASFDIYENQIPFIKEGQEIKIRTNAYPNRDFEGEISFIDPIVNSSTRTIKVRSVLTNREGLFKPGMFIEGIVSGSNMKSENAIMIPQSAVLWTGERSVVYVKTESNKLIFEMREVTIGDSNDTMYLVLKGLNNGEEIVTNGTFTVDAAAQLQGKKSMINKGRREKKTVGEKYPEEFQNKFRSIMPLYFSMKDAFIMGDVVEISSFGKQIAQEMELLKTFDVGKVETDHLDKSIKMIQAIVAKKDLASQRNYFVVFNENLVALSKNLDQLSTSIYIQKCPMANSNKGAIWLSKEQEIRNPYFGNDMLTCGSIIDTLKKS